MTTKASSGLDPLPTTANVWLAALMAAVMAAALGGCAASGPPAEDVLAEARDAIASAESAQAEELAPLELRFAWEKFAEATNAARAGSNQNAIWLAEQAEVSAQLAQTKAQATHTRNQVQSLREQISNLERDIEALKPSG